MRLHTKIILAVVGISSSLYFYKCHKDYYAEHDLVENELNKIEGIKVINIDGNPDLRLEVYCATIELKDGNSLMFECNGSGKGLKDGESFNILKVNNWEFNGTGCLKGNPWREFSLDAGQRSDYYEMRKLGIKNVRDAIAHFDDISRFLNTISTNPAFDTIQRKPDTLFFQKFDSRKISDTLTLKWKECR